MRKEGGALTVGPETLRHKQHIGRGGVRATFCSENPLRFRGVSIRG